MGYPKLKLKLPERLFTFPREDRGLVVEQCSEIQFSRLKYLVPVLLLTAVYFLALDCLLLRSDGGNPVYVIYTVLDVFFAFLQAATLFLMIVKAPFSNRGRKMAGMNATFVYALLNLLWAAGVSAAEVQQTGGITALIITIMAMAALGIFTMSAFFVLATVPIAVFVAAAYAVSGGNTGPLPERMIFLFALTTVSLAISRSLFASTVGAILSTHKLEKLNRELHAMQMSLIQKEKFATIGQLSAGIAHEINNPLGFVKSNFSALEQGIEYLMKKHPEAFQDGGCVDFFSKFPDLFRDTRDGFRRISEVVDNLRAFARESPEGAFEPYDLNAGIESTLVIARNSYAGIARIEKKLGVLPTIRARGSEINQVIMNILLNAVYAVRTDGSGKEGVIRISTWSEDDAVFCEIEDTGTGVEERIRNRIFDPFFTTKPAGEGMGFGLSLSYEIVVNRHGGSLVLQEGLPTRFRLALPIRRVA